MATPPVIVCTPCLRKSKTVDAIKFCVNCNENVCKPCLRQHIKSNANKGHTLLGNDEMPTWMPPRPAVERQFEKKCSRHSDTVVEKYCCQHDVLCCNECISIEHSSCSTVTDITVAAANLDKEVFTGVFEDIKSVVADLKSIKDVQLKYQSKSRKNTVEASAKIRDFRKRLKDRFDELERNSVDAINTYCIENDKAVEENVKHIDDRTTLLEECIALLNSNNVSEIDKFVNMHSGQTLIKDARSLCKDVSHVNEKEVKSFSLNPKIDLFVNELKTIGEFSLSSQRFLNVSPAGHYDIATETDSEVCDIKSVLALKDGTIILADYGNKKLKFLNESFNIVSSLDLSKTEADHDEIEMRCCEPFALCTISTKEIAVTVERDKMVQFVALYGNKAITKDINIGEYCRGLAYSYVYDELYVACGGGSFSGEGLGHIRVYDLSGKLLRLFMKTSAGTQLTPRPMHIAISDDGSHLHIADACKGVVTVDRKGNFLATFNVPELSEARGLCVDVRNDVFVSGSMSDNIIQIGKDGKSHSVLVTECDGVKFPTAICFDTKHSRFIVATDCGSIVKIFDIK